MYRKLHNRIMRRVYYAYALRVGTNPVLLHGFFMLAVLVALTHFVSLGNVIQNILKLETTRVFGYIFSAFLNTELWTLILLGIFIMALFSLRFQLRTPRASQEMQAV